MRKWLTSIILMSFLLIPSFNLSAIDKVVNEGYFQDELRKKESEIKIYPNPVKGNKFNVSAQKSVKSILLNNILGQKVEIDLVKRSDNQFEIFLKDKKQGIHLVLIIFDDNTKEVRRIIVN